MTDMKKKKMWCRMVVSRNFSKFAPVIPKAHHTDMANQKDILHYARLAEQSYDNKYQDSGEAAPTMFVIVDSKDEFCLVTADVLPLSVTQLMFRCQKKDGQVATEFVRMPQLVENTLGLKNPQPMAIVKVNMADVFEGSVVEMPERLWRVQKDFFKLKFLNLEEFFQECEGTGWGDSWSHNVLEMLGKLTADNSFVDTENHQVEFEIAAFHQIVGGDGDFEREFAIFQFSHFEVPAEAWEGNHGIPYVYVCYRFEMTDID